MANENFSQESNPKLQTNIYILIVEDVEDDVILIVENLKRQNFNIRYDIVDNPKDFQKAILTNNYDVILCDHSLPKWTSIDALKILHESHKDVPFIIVSGVIGEDVAVESMRLGAHDYIMKQNLKRLGVAIEREILDAKIRRQKLQAENELKESELKYKNLAHMQTEAVKVRDEFIAIASHELKTPITTLILQIEIALRRLKQGKLRIIDLKSLFEGILRQANILAKLVDNLLSVTMINSGQMQLNIVSGIDLNNFTKEIVGKTKEVSDNLLSIKLSELPVLVDVDPFRLEQVINNLLSNAVKYGDNKPVDIEVMEVENKWAEIRVRDQGHGIKLEDQERIMMPFQRVSTTSYVSGLGLGLFICNEIIKSHGGALLIESAPEMGSVFIVRLPLSKMVRGSL